MNCVTVGRRTTIQVSGAMQDDVRGPAPPFLTRGRDGGRCGQQDVGSPHTVLEAHFNTDGSCGPGGANQAAHYVYFTLARDYSSSGYSGRLELSVF